MSGQTNRKSRGWIWAVAVVVLIGAVAMTSGQPGGNQPVAERDTELIAQGAELYASSCAACHGASLEGTATGPSFLQAIYAPNHHSDEAFQRAAALGVIPHHWDFGPMPAQAQFDREQVAAIVEFIRSEQEAAGVFIDPTH